MSDNQTKLLDRGAHLVSVLIGGLVTLAGVHLTGGGEGGGGEGAQGRVDPNQFVSVQTWNDFKSTDDDRWNQIQEDLRDIRGELGGKK